MVKQGIKFRGKRIVCIITGTGLKDPGVPVKHVEPFPELPPDIKKIEQALGW